MKKVRPRGATSPTSNRLNVAKNSAYTQDINNVQDLQIASRIIKYMQEEEKF